jgi:hypothetical protein
LDWSLLFVFVAGERVGVLNLQMCQYTNGIAEHERVALDAEFGKVAPEFFFSFRTQKHGTISGINLAKDFVADDSPIPLGMRARTYVLVDHLQTTSLH